MANNPGAVKRIRQTETRRTRNRVHMGRCRTAIKRLRAAIDNNDFETAQKLLPETLSIIDGAVSKNVLHRNTAARTKSRLTRGVAKLQETAS